MAFDEMLLMTQKQQEYSGQGHLATIGEIFYKSDMVTSVISSSLVNDTMDEPWDNSTSTVWYPPLPPFLPGDDQLWALENIVWALNVFGVPAIIVFGVAGNLLAFAIFTHTYLRIQSASVYLAFLNATNSVFLACLFVTWLQNHVGVMTIARQGWCQAVTYLSQVSNFLSVWSVVGFTVERWLIVFYPLRKEEFCSRPRALAVVGSLTAVALLLYSHTTWTNEIIVLTMPLMEVEARMCGPAEDHRFMIEVARSVDTVLTLVIPSTSIVALNVGIVAKVVQFSRASRHLDALKSSRAGSGQSHQQKQQQQQPQPQLQRQQTGSSSQRLLDSKALFVGGGAVDNKTMSLRTTRILVQPNHPGTVVQGGATANYVQLVPMRGDVAVVGGGGGGGGGKEGRKHSVRRSPYGGPSYSAAASFNRRCTAVDSRAGQQNIARTRQSYQMRTTRTLLTISVSRHFL
jgi:hypothetical protein